MKVYKCLLTGDEMFTDSVHLVEKDGFYVIKGKYVQRKDGIDESKLGANPSAEGGDDGADDSEIQRGIDVVLDNRLQETGFGSKKDYQVYMKDYMKNVMAKHQEIGTTAEEIAKLKADTATAFKAVCGNFKEYQFFTGASLDPDGHIALAEYVDKEEDGVTVSTPYVYYYKAGMMEEKY